MADYAEDIDGALDAIKEDGGPIVFKIYPLANAPTDPNKPWNGSPQQREDFEHVALLVPMAGTDPKEVNIFSEAAYIPAKGLPFEIVKDTQFETVNAGYTVQAVNLIRPDGVSAILYICEVTKWPLV